MEWNPKQYLAFEDLRFRPGAELMSRIGLEKPKNIVDLGCGTGNLTRLLAKRWPKARITGLDSSPQMLSQAQEKTITWQQGDISQWNPGTKADVIYSNATLHWLGNHDKLFPKLMRYLTPGGVLAVQMPNNFAAPSHTLMQESLKAGPWKQKLQAYANAHPGAVLKAEQYAQLLAPLSDKVDVWETTYYQVMEGPNPVAEWTKGTALKPYLDRLDEPMKTAFEQDYRQRILKAYPPGPDGKTIFPFKRLFIVAQAKSPIKP